MLGQSVDGAGARRGRAERGTPLIRGDFVGIVGIAPVLSVFGGWLGSRYCVLYVLYYINIILVLNIMEPWSGVCCGAADRTLGNRVRGSRSPRRRLDNPSPPPPRVPGEQVTPGRSEAVRRGQLSS